MTKRNLEGEPKHWIRWGETSPSSGIITWGHNHSTRTEEWKVTVEATKPNGIIIRPLSPSLTKQYTGTCDIQQCVVEGILTNVIYTLTWSTRSTTVTLQVENRWSITECVTYALTTFPDDIGILVAEYASLPNVAHVHPTPCSDLKHPFKIDLYDLNTGGCYMETIQCPEKLAKVKDEATLHWSRSTFYAVIGNTSVWRIDVDDANQKWEEFVLPPDFVSVYTTLPRDGIAAHDDAFFMIVGFHGYEHRRRIVCLDWKTNTWRVVASLPTTDNPAYPVLETKLYVVHGYLIFVWITSDDIEEDETMYEVMEGKPSVFGWDDADLMWKEVWFGEDVGSNVKLDTEAAIIYVRHRKKKELQVIDFYAELPSFKESNFRDKQRISTWTQSCSFFRPQPGCCANDKKQHPLVLSIGVPSTEDELLLDLPCDICSPRCSISLYDTYMRNT